MTQRDLNLEKTTPQQDGKPDEKDSEIEVLKGKGSREDIKAKERAKAPERNNMPGVDLS